jgi:hypothetical protein
LAKVEFLIHGADFLKHFYLIVDLSASQLLDTDTLQHFAAGPLAAFVASTQKMGESFLSTGVYIPLL